MDYPTYPVLVGLQKPLEFKGIRGRFLYWMAAVVGVGMMGTLILLTLSNFLFGFLFLLLDIGGGYLLIKSKQKQGLHNKKRYNGRAVYHNIFMIKK